jgi:hypothetical protein
MALSVIGSRPRKYLESTGEPSVLVIRRLRCTKCRRIHHELPDILVPYKRYRSASIEAVLPLDTPLVVAADESTLYRWHQWFLELLQYWIGCLASIALRFGIEIEEDSECPPQSSLRELFSYVGSASGWLARIVRSVVNANLWVQTRSAWMSG